MYFTLNSIQSDALGSFVGFSQHTANFLYMYIFTVCHEDDMFRLLLF